MGPGVSQKHGTRSWPWWRTLGLWLLVGSGRVKGWLPLV